MRILDWGGLLIIVVLAIVGHILGIGEAGPDYRFDRRPDPDMFEPLFWDAETRAWLEAGSKVVRPATSPGILYSRQGTLKEDGRPTSSTGSAVSISRDGYWLTARHVIEGCDEAYLQTGEKEAVKVYSSTIHPEADVALLVTNRAPQGLAVAASLMGKRESFNIGFPKGQPGAVHGQFLGEMTMRKLGRQGFRERVYAWSIVSEIPRRFASLGGLSGGAVIDDGGRRLVESGAFEIAVGGKQPGQRGVGDASTTEVLTARIDLVLP